MVDMDDLPEIPEVEATKMQMAKFLLGYFNGLARQADFPLRVRMIDGDDEVTIRPDGTAEVRITPVDEYGNYRDHFTIVTGTGIRLRVTVQAEEDDGDTGTT